MAKGAMFETVGGSGNPLHHQQAPQIKLTNVQHHQLLTPSNQLSSSSSFDHLQASSSGYIDHHQDETKQRKDNQEASIQAPAALTGCGSCSVATTMTGGLQANKAASSYHSYSFNGRASASLTQPSNGNDIPKNLSTNAPLPSTYLFFPLSVSLAVSLSLFQPPLLLHTTPKTLHGPPRTPRTNT